MSLWQRIEQRFNHPVLLGFVTLGVTVLVTAAAAVPDWRGMLAGEDKPVIASDLQSSRNTGKVANSALGMMYAAFLQGFADGCVAYDNIPEFSRQTGLWVKYHSKAPFDEILKCRGDGFDAYFFTFSGSAIRGEYFTSTRHRMDQSCTSWSAEEDQRKGHRAHVRTCYRAGDGINPAIYWELDDESRDPEIETAGVLISHALSVTELERIWEDHI